MEKTAIALLAEGFEEVEAVTPIDYLRRAGVAVTVAALGKEIAVKGARGVTILADATLADLATPGKADAWDAVVVPGGLPGAANIAASPEARALIRRMAAAGKLVCAICASPVVALAPLGVLDGKKFACYPGMEKNALGGEWVEAPVAVDGNLVTASGAGASGLFSLAIVAALLGEAKADEIARAVLL